ncbi:MAG: dihydrolipoyl dehydrogenase [Flavobacteriales bacterium]
MKTYDVTIIGSGPGGYVAAIRCAQLGFKTALIEKYDTLGGTCLNVGCIPSKALLDSSEHVHQATHQFEAHGIEIGTPKVDFGKMIARKKSVIDQTCSGIDFLMKKNKVDVFHGFGSFKDNQHLIIKTEQEEQIIKSEKTIIATGSKPATLPFAELDKTRIISSTEALKLKEIPKHLIVVGGGVIGLELGSVYARLGTKVSVVEYAPSIIPTMDAALGKELKKVLTKDLKFKFYLNHAVTAVENTGDAVKLQVKNNKKDQMIELEGDYCLLAIGRKAYTDKLGLEKLNIETDQQGRVEINENFQTSHSNIFAIGDVVKGAMLAHKAEEEGVFVAEFIAGQKPHINHDLIPGVVYTWPEVAAVGKTEAELKADQIDYKSGNFPFKASGRARASMDLDGFVKVLADAKTDEVLGVHIIGPRAADLIAEAVVAMEYRASAEDIARICHAHPTFSEALKEAALDATAKRAIHI